MFLIFYLVMAGACMGSLIADKRVSHDSFDALFFEGLLWPVMFPMQIVSALRYLPEERHQRQMALEKLRHKNSMKELKVAEKVMKADGFLLE